MHVIRVETVGDLCRCLDIRRTVFIDEQKVPEDLELDNQDGECTHFLAVDDEGGVVTDIGTARLKVIEDNKGKVQRVAVIASRRKAGVGEALMLAVEREARSRGVKSIVLSSQVSAIPFYEHLGYAAHGAVYDDAGIPHRDMTKAL